VQIKLGKRNRRDGGLVTLTNTFIELLQSQPDQAIDINEVCSLLKVQKRRIYDITNVLEGINIVEKISKNRIQWRGLEGVFNDDQALVNFADEEEMLAVDEDLKARYLAAKEEKQVLELKNDIVTEAAELVKSERDALDNDEGLQKYAYINRYELGDLHAKVTEKLGGPVENKYALAIQCPSGSEVRETRLIEEV
jgi:hypothetical protein